MDAVARKKIHINKSNRTPIRKGDLIFYICLILIPLIQIGIFYFGVNFQSFFLAFQKRVDGKFVFDVTYNWKQFTNDISQQGFWIKVGNSLIVYLFTSLTGTILATLFAYYIYKRRTFSNFFKFILFLPSVLPALLLVIMFQKFVGEGLPSYMQNFFGQQMDNFFLFDKASTGIRFILVTIFTIWISFGGQVLIYTGAMDQIPPEVVEAGKIDGTTSFTEFIHIILPSILSTVGTFLVAGIGTIFTNQNNLFSFFNWNQILEKEETIGYYLFKLVYSSGDASGYCYASFLGLICTIIVIPLSLGLRKIIERATN